MQVLTPEYRRRFAQVLYHVAVTNSPQWQSSTCYPEGMIRWWAQGIRDIQVTVTPHQVQLVSGTALDILRQILIGQKHVTTISQWYGESVGFWDGEMLVAWTKNIQGWWMSHALPEYSSELEAIEVYTRDETRNIHLDITLYDPMAFVAPLRVEVIYTYLDGPESERRYQWKECQQTLWNVNGRLEAVTPGTVIQYRIPDWYDRPWAKIWEEYFEEGMKRPEADESLFDFTGPRRTRGEALVATARSRARRVPRAAASRRTERGEHASRRQRILPEPHAGRVEERIADRGDDGRQHFLAGAAARVRERAGPRSASRPGARRSASSDTSPSRRSSRASRRTALPRAARGSRRARTFRRSGSRRSRVDRETAVHRAVDVLRDDDARVPVHLDVHDGGRDT